jgi:hypothetical protein
MGQLFCLFQIRDLVWQLCACANHLGGSYRVQNFKRQAPQSVFVRVYASRDVLIKQGARKSCLCKKNIEVEISDINYVVCPFMFSTQSVCCCTA